MSNHPFLLTYTFYSYYSALRIAKCKSCRSCHAGWLSKEAGHHPLSFDPRQPTPLSCGRQAGKCRTQIRGYESQKCCL